MLLSDLSKERKIIYRPQVAVQRRHIKVQAQAQVVTAFLE